MESAIKLIGYGTTTTVDDIGQYSSPSTEVNVIAQIRDITQSEFSSAGMVGFKPAKEFRVRSWEYCGERLVEYGGVIYSIYRTYLAPDGRMELYTEERTGENFD
jgi:hypothetical protein